MKKNLIIGLVLVAIICMVLLNVVLINKNNELSERVETQETQLLELVISNAGLNTDLMLVERKLENTENNFEWTLQELAKWERGEK